MMEAPTADQDKGREPPVGPERSDTEPSAPEPSFWQTMKWAMVMLGITLLLAAITIPILQWFE